MVTPIEKMHKINLNNNVYIKREDLLPFSFGGNKVRIAQEFFADMEKQGKNCIIGYGNARSNLSRAIANMAYAKGIECHIVCPADEDGSRAETFNQKMVAHCNAMFHYCTKQEVAQTVSSVISECQAKGLRPYYINGNQYGKGNEAVPVRAYTRVFQQIQRQAEGMGIHFDYIFLPTGTGMTQAGLLIGQKKTNSVEEIVGISIARSKEAGEQAIRGYLCAGAEDAGVEYVEDEKIVICDKYLCGGYGKFDMSIENIISEVFKSNGVPLDPTYTGKAFAGMCEYIKEHEITNKNILFLHTGGTPLFFDYIKKKKPPIVQCYDKERLLCFLEAIDGRLPVPLSSRTNLEDYSAKVLTNGHVLAIEEMGEIVAAILFYCNDQSNHAAYLTLLAVKPQYEGKGYGYALLNEAEKVMCSSGMDTCYLDTDITNNRSISLYSRDGWKIEYVTDKVHMKKELRK